LARFCDRARDHRAARPARRADLRGAGALPGACDRRGQEAHGARRLPRAGDPVALPVRAGLRMALAGEATISRRPRVRSAAALAAGSPFAISCLISVVIAALSAAVLPTVPSYDPWRWLVCGRSMTARPLGSWAAA